MIKLAKEDMELFQFLIGRLKTQKVIGITEKRKRFQFLIGRLKTAVAGKIHCQLR